MTRRRLSGAFALAIFAALAIWWMRPPEDRIVVLPHAMLNAVLADALLRDARVGLLTRVEFDDLRVDWADGARLTREGGWIGTTGSGSRNLPDVAFEGRVPAHEWTLDDGGLGVEAVEIDRATRLAFDTNDARPESDVNRTGWALKVAELLDRSTPFAVVDADPEDWAIGAVEYGSEDVRVTLVPR